MNLSPLGVLRIDKFINTFLSLSNDDILVTFMDRTFVLVTEINTSTRKANYDWRGMFLIRFLLSLEVIHIQTHCV